jgi:ketosteroid isomerase-like protein
MFSTYSDYVAEVEEVRDLDDVTFGRVRLRGHGRGSGAPMEQTQWHLAQWRDSRIVRWRSFASEAEALEAAGMA